MNPAQIARNASPQTAEQGEPRDPQGLKPGMSVTVTPLGRGGDPSVPGAVRSVDRETIVIVRKDEQVGEVCVHFPRVGYRVAVV